MIRRMFWLTAGAVLGISAYRRAGRVVRDLTGPVGRYRLRPPRQPGGLACFVRDVREGMALYAQQQHRPGTERHQSGEGPTLGLHQMSGSSRNGRNGSSAH